MSNQIDPLSIPLPPGGPSVQLPPPPDEIPPPPSPPPLDGDNNVQIIDHPGRSTSSKHLDTAKRKNQSYDYQSLSSYTSDPSTKKAKLEPRKNSKHKKSIDDIVYEGSKEEAAMMKKVMGFSEFDSTKGKMVPGNQVGSVHVVRKRHYRQYMNRKGGFNRPLDKVA